MKPEQYYRKVEIKSVDDLPKEDGFYIVEFKDSEYREDVYFNKNAINTWLDDYSFYLLPVDHLPEVSKTIEVTDEDIENKAIELYESGMVLEDESPSHSSWKTVCLHMAQGYRAGAKTFRSRQSIPTREMPSDLMED
jgi:hypothetical protein